VTLHAAARVVVLCAKLIVSNSLAVHLSVSSNTPPAQMTRSAICGMTATMGLYLLLCSESMLEPVERQPMVRPQATPVDGFDDGCGVPDRLRRDARTNAVCNHPVTHIGPTWSRSAQTYTGDLPAECCTPQPLLPIPEQPDPTLGTTSTLQPESVGRSHRRGRRRVTARETEPRVWLGAVLGAALGLLVAVNPVAAWAWASALGGVGLLMTNTHFWWPVCTALSLNYWCAAAWIAWAVSWDVGVALAVVAFGMRGSVLLFGDKDPADGPAGTCGALRS
jgi:hypothetical protein